MVRFIEDNWLRGERLGGGSFDASAGSIVDMFDFGQYGFGNRPASAIRTMRSSSIRRPARSFPLAVELPLSETYIGTPPLLVASQRRPAYAGRRYLPPNRKVCLAKTHIQIHLVRPSVAPLSAMAQLGQQIFYDTSFSASGQLSCASCHSLQHAYGPPNDGPVVLGGPTLSSQGVRAVPSLEYLERQPPFSIGPDNSTNEGVNLMQMAALGQTAPRAQKTATQAAQAAANLVPQGGLFWDGRANTLQDQAIAPLLDPREMDGGSVEKVAAKLGEASYSKRFIELFGPGIFGNPRLLVAEAMFAVGRYQIEDPSFHPYTSKFDYWLEGKARLSAAEMRGYDLFNDPKNANCGGCHSAQPTRDGLPPLFTDHQYEALGAPRNFALSVNKDPDYFDLGVCGPVRSDIATQTNIAGCL